MSVKLPGPFFFFFFLMGFVFCDSYYSTGALCTRFTLVFMMEGVLPRTSKNRRCVDVLRRPNVENNGPVAKQTFIFFKNLLPKATMGMKARIVNSDPLELLTSPHFQIHWMSLWLTLILGASLKIVPSSAMHIFWNMCWFPYHALCPLICVIMSL